MISAGLEAQPLGPHRWSVPKGVIVSMLDAHLHSGTLRFAEALRESATLREELKDFTRSVSQAGRYSYAARSTQHDDCVLAVGCGLWALVGRPEPARAAFSIYSATAPPLTYGR